MKLTTYAPIGLACAVIGGGGSIIGLIAHPTVMNALGTLLGVAAGAMWTYLLWSQAKEDALTMCQMLAKAENGTVNHNNRGGRDDEEV